MNVTQHAWSKDKRLMSVGFSGSSRIDLYCCRKFVQSLEDQNHNRELCSDKDGVCSLDWDGTNRLLSVRKQTVVSIWRQSSSNNDENRFIPFERITLDTPSDAICCGNWDPSCNNRLALGSSTGKIHLGTILNNDGKIHWTSIPACNSPIAQMAWHPSGTCIALTTADNRTVVVCVCADSSNPVACRLSKTFADNDDVLIGAVWADLGPFPSWIAGISWSPFGEEITTACRLGTWHIWRPFSSRSRIEDHISSDAITSVVMIDADRIALGGPDCHSVRIATCPEAGKSTTTLSRSGSRGECMRRLAGCLRLAGCDSVSTTGCPGCSMFVLHNA